MARLILAVALAVAAAGCVAYSKVMVNPASGQQMICQAHGGGLIGAAHAGSIQDRCEESLRAAGYVPLDELGAVGLILGEALEVLKMPETSPAKAAGVEPGDILTEIDGRRISKKSDANTMLLGKPGESIALTFRRGEAEIRVTVIRLAYTEVYGGKAATPDPS